MSYILDALRKSDQMRRRGAAPTLLLGQAPPPAPKRPVLFSYGLLAFVLLGAGIAIGWLRPWETAPAAPEPAIAVKPVVPKEAPAPRPEAPAKPEPVQQAQYSAPVAPAVHAPAAAAVQPRESSGAGQTSAPTAAAKQTAPAPVRDQRVRAAAEPAPLVMKMSELPLVIQQELPTLSITVHAYSDKAADRLVGINDRLLHEGDEVAPGLKLEQITPDGMILGYKGYNFRRGVH